MSALDPSLFAPESIDAETAEFNRKLEAALAAAPTMTAFPPSAIRKAREEGRSIWGPVQTVAEARERRISGPAGELRLRVLVPDAVRGVYLHMHGGGWTLGAANQSDVRNWAIARHCGLATVSVEYRLAPEHAYPAGPDDCEAAALWLVEQRRRRVRNDTAVDRRRVGGRPPRGGDAAPPARPPRRSRPSRGRTSCTAATTSR